MPAKERRGGAAHVQQRRGNQYALELTSNRVPVEVLFRDLHLHVRRDRSLLQALFGLCQGGGKQQERYLHVLKGVSGRVRPGQMLAVLGSSGSGKTTLLNFLAGRDTTSLCGGQYSVNEAVVMGDCDQRGGVPSEVEGDTAEEGAPLLGSATEGLQRPTQGIARVMKVVSGYVKQEDTLPAYLTVRECLEYAAKLRLPSSVSKDQLQKRLEGVIRELNLKNVEESLIGGAFKRGISGGEKRRVSIGMQMLTDPSIIFLDEPTSGLDGFNAKNVMQTLLDLARRDRTVVCTIHQPRSDIFHLFDQVMFLSAGQVVFFGPAHRLDQHLFSVGYPLPGYTNPADFAIDLMTVDRRTAELRDSTERRLENLVASYQASPLFQEIFAEGEEKEKGMVHDKDKDKDKTGAGDRYSSTSSASSDSSCTVVPLAVGGGSDHPQLSLMHFIREHASNRKVSLWRQTMLLVSRFYRTTFRDPKMFWTNILMVVGTSLMMGVIMLRMSTDQVGIQDRFAALYLLSTMAPYNMMVANIVNYESQRFVFAREKEDHLYSPAAFFWSKTIAEFPLEILYQLIFTSIVYWLEGLVDTAESFFLTAAILMSSIYAMNSLGLLVATLINRISTNTVAANTVFTLFLFSAGWAFNLDTIPPWISWIKPVSPLKYTLEAFSKTQFSGQTFSCPGHQAIQPGNICPIPDGETALHYFSMDNASLQSSFIFLWSFSGVMRLGVFLALYWIPQRPQ